MSKLLAAELSRMKKSRCFIFSMIFMLVLGLLMPLLQLKNMKQYGLSIMIESTFFTYAVFIGVLLAVFASLYIGTEFSDGTIRNKLIVGHNRTSIYLVEGLVTMIAGCLMCLTYIIIYTLLGIPLLGFFTIDFTILILFILCSFMMSFAYAAIYTMIAMLIQNKALTSVVCILGAFILLIGATYINSQLNQPKTYEAYSFNSGGSGELEIIENPRYLTGLKRTAYEFLYDFLPPCQAVQLSDMSAAHPWLMSLYSFLIILFVTPIGIYQFKKKDIN